MKLMRSGPGWEAVCRSVGGTPAEVCACVTAVASLGSAALPPSTACPVSRPSLCPSVLQCVHPFSRPVPCPSPSWPLCSGSGAAVLNRTPEVLILTRRAVCSATLPPVTRLPTRAALHPPQDGWWPLFLLAQGLLVSYFLSSQSSLYSGCCHSCCAGAEVE